jgi:chromosome segregation ATPase
VKDRVMTAERELRDRLEQLQAENRSLRRRVAELEDAEARAETLSTEVTQLRRQLELADEARDKWGEKLAVMQRKDLEAHVRVLETDVSSLRRQLELADEVRDSWATDATRLRRELAIAREEQVRLRRVLDQERLDHKQQLKKAKKK